VEYDAVNFVLSEKKFVEGANGGCDSWDTWDLCDGPPQTHESNESRRACRAVLSSIALARAEVPRLREKADPSRWLPLVPLRAPDLNRDHHFPKMRPALQIPESVRGLCKGKDFIDHRLEPIL